MGEAKHKAAKPNLNSSERILALGTEPFMPAFDLVFGMVEHVYSHIGGVTHQLIGIDFEAGKPIGVNTLDIRHVTDVPYLRSKMLEKWPMVAHVFEAWAAPDASAPPSAHPLRYDVVNIMLHTNEIAAVAPCRVDAVKKLVERAELIYPDQIGGRLGREMPTRH